ncbi:MAG: UDP-3-O-(3-hydroxymyristoyl)glucosamine N-acyltransferase [Cyanobacteria bacterium P01_E01_bin.48]
MKLSELAQALHCTWDDTTEDLDITGVASLQDAQPGDLTFVSEPAYAPQLAQTGASAAIVPPQLDVPDRVIGLSHPHPRLAFARAIALFYQPYREHPGIHPTAVVAPDAQLGNDVAVGPYAVIMSGVCLGDRVQVHAHAVIYPQVSVGADSILFASCVIHERTQIGSQCLIHSGAIIGDDGFGHVPQQDGSWYRMLQSGRVVIGDDVDIGSNTTIDRAAVGETHVGSGVKIDNLVQVAHGARIGKNSLIVAQVGLAGGCTLGQNVVLAGQVGVAGHITVGDRVVAASRTGISSDLAADRTVAGFPQQTHQEWLRSMAAVRNLPDLVQKVRDLKNRMAQLEQALADPPQGSELRTEASID